VSDDRQAGIKGLNFYALLIGLLVVTQEGDRVLGCSAGFAGFYALLIGLLVATYAFGRVDSSAHRFYALLIGLLVATCASGHIFLPAVDVSMPC